MNLEQEITRDLGAFVRAGWANGDIEPYEFTDIDRTAAAGLSLNGKQWGRPDDTVGLAGVVNGISKIHQEFLNDGGLGILIGDGMLPHPGPEQVIETYYSYALSASTHLTADYQFIVNPGYNEDRGPADVFSATNPLAILRRERVLLPREPSVTGGLDQVSINETRRVD